MEVFGLTGYAYTRKVLLNLFENLLQNLKTDVYKCPSDLNYFAKISTNFSVSKCAIQMISGSNVKKCTNVFAR